MELRELRYFQAVARCKNISRAAEQLHISQPSISIALQKLESELGVMLLDRSKKRVTLTNEGHAFLVRVEEILNRVDYAVAEMHDLASCSGHTLRIGVPPMIGTFLFPRLLVEFKQHYPDIKLEIWEGGSMSIQSQIEQGKIDLGIVILSEAPKRLQTLKVWQSEIVVCMNRTNPLSTKSVINVADIIDEPLIMLKEGFYNRHMIIERFHNAGVEPNIVLSSNQIQTIKSLLSANVGIAFLFRDIIMNDSINLCGIPFNPPAYEPIGLAWKKETYLPKLARVFIDFIIESYQT